jgi:hypothetical protein
MLRVLGCGWVVVMAVVGCTPSPASPDVGSALDAGPAPYGTFFDRGFCFPHSPPCATHADCPSESSYCRADGRCQLGAPCGCISDDVCRLDEVCLNNEAVCGYCTPARSACADDSDCGPTTHCVRGICETRPERCPGA